MSKKIKKAFTLAEVLITLVIIGVVAAFTIPVLINNYQKTQYVTQLKDFYSSFSSGLKAYMALNNCSDLKCTGLFDDDSNGTHKIQELPKIFKIIKNYTTSQDNTSVLIPFKTKYLAINSTNNYFSIPTFVNTNGALIWLQGSNNCSDYSTSNSKLQNSCGLLFVDVNGFKPPNQWGRDTFQFIIGNDGILYAILGSEYRKANGMPDLPTNYSPACSTNSSDSGASGMNCSVRIIEEGWQMNY